ncbi:MAG: DUF3098 domain-containing protein [Muribaculaceae bacterium]|nr:DUF3098 domain-containing protein [Bacteroides sp.]MDE6681716.1 DUF3098 domain-containing protein [Muribaculaceae bacterium]MDE6842142.1 DUF3098 domain-containing protein [Muribaculaceae bacterium]
MSYTTPTNETAPLQHVSEREKPFTKTNFLLMALCLLLIILGFALMSGSGSSVEGGYNPDIFSTRRIVVGPTIAFAGFLLMAFAIVWQPKHLHKNEPNKTKLTDNNNGMD